MKVQFDNIVSFVAVVDEGSFSSAARKIGKSQSTISTAVQNLESDLGFSLFIRDKSRVSLTDKGKRFYHLSNSLAYKYRDLLSAAKQMNASERLVYRVGIDPLILCEKVKSSLVQFTDAFPHIDLLVVTKPSAILSSYLNDGKIDIAIGNPYQQAKLNNGYEVQELFQTNFWWVCHENMGDEELSSARWLLMDGSEELLNRSTSLNSIWNIDDISTILDLCFARKGIAFLPEHTFHNEALPSSVKIIRNNPDYYGKAISTALLWPTHSEFTDIKLWFEKQLKISSNKNIQFVASLSV